MPRLSPLVALVAALAIAAAGCGEDAPVGSAGPGAGVPTPATVDLPAPDTRGERLFTSPIELIDGTTLPAARLRGRVVLVVNTASKCGFAPQFEDLEGLSAARSAEGLTVVGFPSDDFAQELDDAGAIAEFCELNYGVRFPMAAPGRVTGPDAQPVFRALAAQGGAPGREPDWNFTKYLLDRRGRLVARYESYVEPDDPRVTATIDRLLAETGDT